MQGQRQRQLLSRRKRPRIVIYCLTEEGDRQGELARMKGKTGRQGNRQTDRQPYKVGQCLQSAHRPAQFLNCSTLWLRSLNSLLGQHFLFSFFFWWILFCTNEFVYVGELSHSTETRDTFRVTFWEKPPQRWVLSINAKAITDRLVTIMRLPPLYKRCPQKWMTFSNCGQLYSVSVQHTHTHTHKAVSTDFTHPRKTGTSSNKFSNKSETTTAANALQTFHYFFHSSRREIVSVTEWLTECVCVSDWINDPLALAAKFRSNEMENERRRSCCCCLPAPLCGCATARRN